MDKRRIPRLLAISDRLSLAQARPGMELAGWANELAEAGVDGLQLRERDLRDRTLYALAAEVRRHFPGRLLVNRRIDIALASGADGVHLPGSGLPVGALRERFGAAVLIGCSTHHLSEVEAARSAGADYATFGPVFPSPGKGLAVGLGALRQAVAFGLPILALGGVSASRAEEVLAQGAWGIAGIRLFQEPSQLHEACRLMTSLAADESGAEGSVRGSMGAL